MGAFSRWKLLSDFATIIMHTGFATNGRPQSLFLISDPGHGKTELLNRFSKATNAIIYSDITMQPFMRALQLALEGKITHIIIPEFQKVISRRKDVSQNFLTLLLEAMEEGVTKVAMGPTDENYSGARLGILGASTYDSMQKNTYLIDDLAMDSRAFFIDACATREEIMDIETRIALGKLEALAPIKINVPVKKIEVFISPKIALQCQPLVREMQTANIPVYGVRTYARFLHVLRGIAIKDSKDYVLARHFEELVSFKKIWLDLPNIGRSGRGSRFAVSKT